MTGSILDQAGLRFKSSVALLSVASLLPLVAGYLREAVTAYAMGTTAGADAFAVSMFYVDGISVVAAVGVASYTLVPMFAAQLVEGRSDEAFRLLETASLWLLAFALPIAIACTLAPVPLARFVAPRFTPGQTQLLAGLVPASAWSASLLLLGAVAAGNLQARSQYGWPVAGRALLALSVAGGIWTAAKTNPIRGAALGLLIGAIAQLLLQWWRLWASGWRPRRPRWANPELPATVHLALPAVGATLLTNVVMSGGQSLIASGLPEGSLASVSYALRTMNLVANITLAIATVSLTELSLAVRRGSSGHLALREVLRDSFETGVFLLVPLAVVVFVWAEPLLNVLFVRGSFDTSSLERTTSCLRWYVLSVLPGFLNTILLRTQPALGRPSGLFGIAAIWCAATVGTTALLLGPLGPQAVPAGFLIGQLVASSVGGLATLKVVGLPLYRQVGRYLARIAVLTGTLAVVVRGAEQTVLGWLGPDVGSTGRLLLDGAAAVLVLTGFVGLCAWLRDRHLAQFVDSTARLLGLAPERTSDGPDTDGHQAPTDQAHA